LQDAHAQLARSCIHFLSLDLGSLGFVEDEGPTITGSTATPVLRRRGQANSTNARLLFQTLLSYALGHGFEHLAHLGTGNKLLFDEMQVLQDDIQQHPSKWKKICAAISAYNEFQHIASLPEWSNPKHDFVFYILVGFAPVSLLESFLDFGAPIAKDEINPLIYAAFLRKTHHAQILLSRGVNVNHDGWVVNGSCQALPLEAAVMYGNGELVDLFLAEGSQVPEHLFDCALPVKESQAKISLTLVRKLLQTDEFVEWALAGQYEQFLLHRAFQQPWYNYHREENILVDITCRLIQVGCNPSTYDSNGRTALHTVACQGYVSVMQYLLSMEITVPHDILFAAVEAPLCSDFWERSALVQMTHILIAKGADVHVLASNGDSVLHATINHRDEHHGNCLQVAKMLIDAGCNPSLCNSEGRSPLQVAVTKGRISVVEYLLTLGIPLPSDILLTAMEGYKYNPVKKVRMLITKGADVHVLASNGDSVLHAAICYYKGYECLQMVKMFIDAGCNPSLCNSDGKTPLHVALTNLRKHISVVKLLLTLDITLPHDILFAAMYGDRYELLQAIHMLIAKGADVHVLTSNGDNVLHTAIKHLYDYECLQVAKMLIDAGCNPSLCNSDGKLPLHLALASGHVSVVEYLLALGISLPCDILFAAVEGYRYKTMKSVAMFITKGADIHVLTSNGNSVLHAAIYHFDSHYYSDYHHSNDYFHLEIVKILINAGCNPSLCNSDGKTPLHIAAEKGCISIMEYLLPIMDIPLTHDILFFAMRVHELPVETMHKLISKGANIHVLWPNGDSALSMDVLLPHNILLSAMEAPRGQAELTHMLIDKGADVYILTSNGDGLLHVIISQYGSQGSINSYCMKKLMCTLEVLVNSGCDPSTCNLDGKTPLHLAVAGEYQPVVEYLLPKTTSPPGCSDDITFTNQEAIL
jgi:ankyrin repeat protein